MASSRSWERRGEEGRGERRGKGERKRGGGEGEGERRGAYVVTTLLDGY